MITYQVLLLEMRSDRVRRFNVKLLLSSFLIFKPFPSISTTLACFFVINVLFYVFTCQLSFTKQSSEVFVGNYPDVVVSISNFTFQLALYATYSNSLTSSFL